MATTGPALFPGASTFPGTSVFPGQGQYALARCRFSYDDASVSTPNWVDVSADLRSFSISRGREDEFQDFDAGSCTVVLNNRTRAYDPTTHATLTPMNRIWIYEEFSSEVHDLFHGYTTSWNQGWPASGYDATTEVQAVEEFQVFSLSALANTDPPRDNYADVVQSDFPTGYWRMEESGQVLAATVGDQFMSSNSTVVSRGNPSPVYDEEASAIGGVGGTYLSVPSGGALFTDISNTPMGDPAGSNGMTLEFWFQFTAVPAGGSTLIAGPVDAGAFNKWAVFYTTTPSLNFECWNSSHTGVTANGPAMLTGVWYHVACSLELGNVKIYLNGSQVASTALSGSFSADVAAAGSYMSLFAAQSTTYYDELAFYPYPLGGGRINAHYVAGAQRGFPQQGSDARAIAVLDAISSQAPRAIASGGPTGSTRSVNVRRQRGQYAIEELRAASQAEKSEGAIFIAATGGVVVVANNFRSSGYYATSQDTFGDGGGAEIPYVDVEFDYGDSFLYNEINVTRTGGKLQTTSDAASIARYYRRSYSLTDLPLISDSDALDVAGDLLVKYRTPMVRVQSLSFTTGDPNVAYAVLRRDLLDKITFKRTPIGGGGRISQDLWIQKVELSGSADNPVWQARWSVSPF